MDSEVLNNAFQVTRMDCSEKYAHKNFETITSARNPGIFTTVTGREGSILGHVWNLMRLRSTWL